MSIIPLKNVLGFSVEEHFVSQIVISCQLVIGDDWVICETIAIGDDLGMIGDDVVRYE